MNIDHLTGKNVTVTADGILYTGILREVSDGTVEIQTEDRWLSIPMDKVSSITEVE